MRQSVPRLFLITMILFSQVQANEQLAYHSQSAMFVEVSGKHTAVILPVKRLDDDLLKLAGPAANSPFIRFGWGDKEYYGADDKTLAMTYNALFRKTMAVIEVATLDKLPLSDSRVYKVALNQNSAENVQRFIKSYFAKDSSGMSVLYRTNSVGDHFYQSFGEYHVFKNCNNWTGELLSRIDSRIEHKNAFLAPFVERQFTSATYELLKAPAKAMQ